jgi:RimJ/RimL family protein N-acetyltransferase
MPDDAVLFGTRILLRAPRVADAAVLFASVTSDPKVTEYLSWTPHPDVDETRRGHQGIVQRGRRPRLGGRAA